MVTPEIARAVHDDRRRRFLAEAEVRRVRRELAAARRAERPARRPSGWLRALVRGGRHHHDAKITRLAGSWLELDDQAAQLLARVADEVDVPAGATLVPGRFSYIGLDDAHQGLLVMTGTPPVTIESAATVLVLTTDDLEAIMPAVPRLAMARSQSPAPSTHADVARPPDDTRDTMEPGRFTLHDPFAAAPDNRGGGRRRDRVVRRPTVLAPASDRVQVERAVAGSSSRG